MPFCHLTLKGDKPLPPSYPDDLQSVGDHLRTKRLENQDYQREVAEEMGVNPDTVKNWEVGHTEPELRYIPRIIAYLEYVPFEKGDTLGEKLQNYRKITGTPRSELADQIGVDENTLRRWEIGETRPTGENLKRVRELISETGRVVSDSLIMKRKEA